MGDDSKCSSCRVRMLHAHIQPKSSPNGHGSHEWRPNDGDGAARHEWIPTTASARGGRIRAWYGVFRRFQVLQLPRADAPRTHTAKEQPKRPRQSRMASEQAVPIFTAYAVQTD